ncbi:GNAT family N-acetyltransferase [Stappia sp. 28M-7]|uniref:GNAT family N-acetyltransferase n=1 Tax=Stappia sp. 28M-7 TaxID=2762596 RepID=UPI000E76FA69|nr:GNAT family N-acetyltransferase [Stappia sp. 28M-7]MBC2857742.1 GNAT family N-acetyltransferase [Stappia sp. 28M-7]
MPHLGLNEGRLSDRLATRRLVLRPLEPADAEAIDTLCSRDHEIVRWLTGMPWPAKDGAAAEFVAAAINEDPLTGEAAFAVTLGGIVIGLVAIKAPGELAEHPDCPSIGYWIGRPFQGFGYAGEAAAAALDWGFAAHRCQAMAARAFADNAASLKVLARLGFRRTGRMMRHSLALGREVENVVLRLEHASRPGADARQVEAAI